MLHLNMLLHLNKPFLIFPINFDRSFHRAQTHTPSLFEIPKDTLKHGNLRLFLLDFMTFPWTFISQMQFGDFYPFALTFP